MKPHFPEPVKVEGQPHHQTANFDPSAFTMAGLTIHGQRSGSYEIWHDSTSRFVDEALRAG